jgi:hypothetical protein
MKIYIKTHKMGIYMNKTYHGGGVGNDRTVRVVG